MGERVLPPDQERHRDHPLLKKGKPASNPDSYRPVSLTSCVAKTMEGMIITSRLAFLAEKEGW